MSSQINRGVAPKILEFVEASLLGGRSIDPGENLLLSGLVDSLGVMALVSEIERLTEQPIPLEDVILENFESIDAISAYLAARG